MSYLFSEMEVGDSFNIGDYDPEKVRVVMSAARQWRKKAGNENKRITTRKQKDGSVRAWRIK